MKEPADDDAPELQHARQLHMEVDETMDNQSSQSEKSKTEASESSFNKDHAEAPKKAKNVNIKQTRRRSIGAGSLLPDSPHEHRYPPWTKPCRASNQAMMMKEAKHRENCANLMNTSAGDVYTHGFKRSKDRNRYTSYRFGMISSTLLPMDNSLTEYSGYMSRRNIFIYSGKFEDITSDSSDFISTSISFPKRGYRDPASGENFYDIASFKRTRSHNF